MTAKGETTSGLKGLPTSQTPVPRTSQGGGESEDLRFFNLNVRAFIFKALQIVVLSRTGNKFAYNSQKIGGSITNCYLSLEDDPEIAAEIKKELSSNFMLGPGDSVTLEIYGERNSREVISLEVWHFHMAPVEAPSSSPGSGGPDGQQETVIHSMNRLVEILGLALKSLLCITRVLPAYYLSRDPPPDLNLKFLYKINPSPPPQDMTGLLGANPKSKRIMCALTEMGRFELHTYYRLPPAFSNVTGGGNIGMHARPVSTRGRQWSPEGFNEAEEEEEEEGEETQELANYGHESAGRSQRLRSPPPAARADSTEPPEGSEVLFESLLKEAHRIDQMSRQQKEVESTGEEEEEEEGEDDLQFELDDAGSRPDADDDDHSLDLPFALDSGDVELNRLLSDLHRAAGLEMFRSNCSAFQQIECIEQQLEIFEKELKEFDDMIVYQDPEREID